MKSIHLILISLFSLSLSACSFDDWKTEGSKAIKFGTCATPEVLNCLDAIYGGKVTIEQVRAMEGLE